MRIACAGVTVMRSAPAPSGPPADDPWANRFFNPRKRKMLTRKLFAYCAGLLMIPGLTGGATAQDYPAKPVRLIVGFPPGGTVDIVARMLAQGMRDAMGQQVIVDNRAGANGAIGTELVTRAQPDGYTLGLVSISTMVLNVHLSPNTPYHTLRDFTPVGTVGQVPSVIAVHPAVPARSLKALIALARSRPGKLMFGSSGVGSLQHLTIEMLNSLAEIKVQHVAYKGAVPAMTDVLGGHIDGLVVSLPGVLGAARAGKLNVLVVTGDQRSPALPDVSTPKEQGMPELVVVNWYAVAGPANIPPRVLGTLHAAVTKAAAMPAVKEKFSAAGIEPRTDPSPGAFARFVREEYTRWQQVVQKSGVKVE